MTSKKTSSKKLTSLQLRVLSSFILVPVFVLSIYLGGFIFFLLMAALLFISFDEWSKMAQKSPTTGKDCIYGSAYLAIGLSSLFLLRLLPAEAAYVTLSLFFIIWACDTGAYFSGKIFGGKKLCPSISPGKTWAGLIGGVLAGGLIAYICHIVFGIYGTPVMAVNLGLTVALAGQGGDLIISKYKRYVGVKDTGTLIPGHGGILDRIDSILLAAPIYLIFIFSINDTVSL